MKKAIGFTGLDGRRKPLQNASVEIPMDEKIPRTWLYIIVALLLSLAAVLVGKSMLSPEKEPGGPTQSEQKSEQLNEKNRQIEEIDSRLAQLTKDLEDSGKKMDELQARLAEAIKSASAPEERRKGAPRENDRTTSGPPNAVGSAPSRPVEPRSQPVSRRPAEPGAYEVVRPTTVFEEPSGSARKVSTIPKGTTVNVVRSTGDWLEVRSKHGNPPGYIRRDDAMLIERTN